MNRKLTSITGLIVIAVIVLAVNLIGVLMFGRFKADMTEEKLFTLSDGSKEIVRSLDDHLTATLYFSRQAVTGNPRFAAFSNVVVELLEEYQAVSGGKFKLEIVDPQPDTEEELWAERYGLQAIPGADNQRVYLGLVVKDESGNERTIPFFGPDREGTLEYDISRLIADISTPEKKKIGLLSSLPVMGQQPQANPMMQTPPQRPWMLVRELSAANEVVEIEPSAIELPSDLDLLVLIHPKQLSDDLRYAIDQYVLGGGNALVFVDPFCEVEQAASANIGDMQARMQMSFSSNLPELFETWGIEMETGDAAGPMGQGAGGKIVADPALGVDVQTQQGLEKMLVWLGLSSENLNDEEVVTSQLENVIVATAGALKQSAPSDEITLEPLMTTSDDANTIGDMMLKFGMNPDAIRREYEPGTLPITLGYKITGSFRSAFPGGRPVAGEEGEPAEPQAGSDHLVKSKEPATIIVVSDVDMISDRYSVRVQNIFGMELAQKINDNLSFAANAVENLTGNQALIGLRSRGVSQRPFTRIQEITRAAQAQWREKEEALNSKLQDAERRLNELQRGTEDQHVLDQAYLAEVEKLREERAQTRKELREVRRMLREDVEGIGAWLKFVNIALIPLLVIFVSVIVAMTRASRRRQAQQQQHAASGADAAAA